MIDEITLITQHEGFRGNPYKDIYGNWTIGIGTKCPITVEEAKALLMIRLDQIKVELHKKITFFDTLPYEAKIVLYDMAYNIGVPKLMKFKRMLEAMKKKDWNMVIEEIKDSRYYYQVTSRAENNIRIIKSLIRNDNE